MSKDNTLSLTAIVPDRPGGFRAVDYNVMLPDATDPEVFHFLLYSLGTLANRFDTVRKSDRRSRPVRVAGAAALLRSHTRP